jgi:hypothetical protein
MKEIPLTQNQIALVDDEDYAALIQYSWQAYETKKTWYARGEVHGSDGKPVQISMHRYLLNLQRGDLRKADHIDHNGLHNWRSNLRVVTNQQNGFNRQGDKGYYWIRRERRFMAYIKVGGKLRYLGHYDTAFEARLAYLVAKGQLHVMPGCESHNYLIVGAEG